MKKGLTEIVAILDKSGSMRDVESSALKGINQFIEDQKTVPGDATLTLALFDTTLIKKFDSENIKNVTCFEENDFKPSGNTALLDAIGKTINEVDARIEALSDEEKPEKVIVAILTDGMENSSREFSRNQIFDKITHQREKYGWEFIFLGANQDSFATGSGMGISKTVDYSSDSFGTQEAYSSASNLVRMYRTTGSVDGNEK